jgi:hypothetical protein
MAGQPQEPSWTPAAQEQTQARPAWPQQPSFTPPAPGQQDSYGYPPPPAAGGYPPPTTVQPGYQEQAYGQEQAYSQEQGYAAQEQTYAGQDQVYGSAGQQYQAQPQPDPGAPQWQATPGMPHGRSHAGNQKSAGQQGFVSSLFDFSFTSMVTPKIIKVLYAIYTIWTLLGALFILALGFIRGGAVVGLVVLLVVVPIYLVLSLGIYRVILEGFMVIFRIYEEVIRIREQGDRRSSQL